MGFQLKTNESHGETPHSPATWKSQDCFYGEAEIFSGNDAGGLTKILKIIL